ncbi:MAG: glycosyltransferase family 2 protein [Bacteroidota bacterium]
MKVNKLSIIIPAYNEGRTITQILDKVKGVELIEDITKQIIIVDDCSSDNTREVIAEYIDSNTDMEIIAKNHERNKGKGAALRTGITAATGEYLIIC